MDKIVRDITELYANAEAAANQISFKHEFALPDLEQLLKSVYIRAYVDATKTVTVPVPVYERTTTTLDLHQEMWKSLLSEIQKSPRFKEMFEFGGTLTDAVSCIMYWLSQDPNQDKGPFIQLLQMVIDLPEWTTVREALLKIHGESDISNTLDSFDELYAKIKLLQQNTADSWS